MLKSDSRNDSIELSNELSELKRLSDRLEVLGEKWGVSEDVLFAANLALSEVVSNAIRHGYEEPRGQPIQVGFELRPDELILTIRDEAPAFNPLEAPEPDISAPLEERKIGGLGIYLVKKVMDGVSYQRSGSTNVLTLSKRLGRSSSREEPDTSSEADCSTPG